MSGHSDHPVNSSPFPDYSSSEIAVLPHRTIWAIFWFALFGAAALVLKIWLFGVDTETECHRTGGPMQPPVVVDQGAALERDAELLVRSERIVHPHQPLEMTSASDFSRITSDLRALAYGRRQTPVRILHYGDSILTTDELSGRIRYILQKRFGDGGHGFVLLNRPWQWYHHVGVKQGTTADKWQIRPFTSAPLADGMYGLGGVAFQARHGYNARAWVSMAKDAPGGRAVRHFEVSYLEQPGGGDFKIYLNGELKRSVSTNGKSKVARSVSLNVPLGTYRLKVESGAHGKIRLFGVVMENGEPGVVYDSLAVNGARATSLARFDETHFDQVVAMRHPSLIVIGLGANEGANKFLNLKQYRVDFDKVLKMVKRAGQGASCLVFGPLDQARREPNGRLGSKKMPIKLSRVQRAVALENGCAFFDTLVAMGGEGSMGKWATSGLGGADFIHPTPNGAQKLGNWLAEALLHAFQAATAKEQE